MRAIEILKREHQLILRGLEVARSLAAHLRAGDRGVADEVRTLGEFLRDFADGHHHAKEEDLLFPWMHAMGMPVEAGPIACMLAEHCQGRSFVQDILGGVDDLEASWKSVAMALDGFAMLLEHHIAKEDNILFVMAERLGEGDETLLPAYEAAQPDRELVEARAQRTIESLERSLGLGSEAVEV